MSDAASSVNGSAVEAPQPEASAAPHPSEAGGTVTTATSTAKTAGPLTLDALRAIPEDARTPYQRKRLRELERDAKKAAKKAERDAAKKKADAPAAAAPAAAEDDDQDDEQRKRETAGAWGLVFRLVGLVASLFGYDLDKLTDKERAEDAALLLPLVRRYKWLDLTVRYAALPVLLIERVAGKLHRREAPKK